MEDGKRIYKGEGTISFVAYYPFARGVYKFETDTKDIINVEEWIDASGLKGATKDNYNSFSEEGSCNLYNAGDLPTDFKLIVNIENKPTNITLKTNENQIIGSLNFSLANQGSDTYVRFNSATQLIEGLIKSTDGEFELTGNLYNKYITDGDWFKIPIGESIINIAETSHSDKPTIDYDYLYY